MKKLSKTELSVLSLTGLVILMGFILLFLNKPFYSTYYVAEDGIVEWLTVIGLLAGTFVCFTRTARLYKRRGFLFSLFTFLLGVLMFFVAGEEISWGQRIFNIQSSEFFLKNNAQEETNLHNLVVNGVKINMIVFSFLLIAVLAVYLGIVPYFYKKNNRFKNLLDKNGVIVPRLYHTVSIILVFAATNLLPDERKAELSECGAVLVFLLLVSFPLNRHIFSDQQSNAIVSN